MAPANSLQHKPRPGCDRLVLPTVHAYRAHVDSTMERLRDGLPTDNREEIERSVEHLRAGYRNLLHPHDRWQLGGVHLAEDF